MTATVEVRPLLAGVLASLSAYGYQVKGGLAWREDSLLRVVALRPGPAHGKDSVTIDFTVALGLPGLSVPDKHGSTFAFDNGLATLGRPRAVRQYTVARDAAALTDLLAGDVAQGRAWLDRWQDPDEVLRAVLDGEAVGHHSPGLAAERGACWAAYLGDPRLDLLLDALRRADPVSDVDESLEVIYGLVRARQQRRVPDPG